MDSFCCALLIKDVSADETRRGKKSCESEKATGYGSGQVSETKNSRA